jgi:cytochrome P450
MPISIRCHRHSWPIPLHSTSLQREARVFYAPAIGYHVVTRYADIETVFLDHETYSAAPAQLPLVPLGPEAAQILRAAGTAPRPSMVSLDPPAHTRLRSPTVRAFTPQRVAQMSPRIAILLKVTDALVGLRVDQEAEETGLDLSEHEERAYAFES